VQGEVRVTIDGPGALVIDTQGLKAPLPPVQGVTYTPEFRVLVLRKLFTLNCAHAVAAYLGYREGCRFIHEAARHPRVAPVLRGALAEAQAALTAAFPPHAAAIAREAEEALAHIANPRLADSISRVARAAPQAGPLRERLLGPAHLAHRHHLPYEHLCVAIAAALAYDDPADAQAVALQEAIAAEGLDTVLTEDCGLLPHEELARAQVKGCCDEGLFPVREGIPPAPQSHPGRGLRLVGALRHRGHGPVSRGGAAAAGHAGRGG
jgi:mannitol-1-phosphate 5-dehydrogenase